MIKTVLVGHRGVGKSTLLDKLKRKRPNVQGLSLDQWIEEKEGRPISEIFKTSGEVGFRELEKKYFSEICEMFRSVDLIVDLGAGFEGSIPEEFKVIWIQRAVDPSSFLFLNRPPLDGRSSLRMSQERFELRQKRFLGLSDLEIEIPEGFEQDENTSVIADSLLRGSQINILESASWYLTLLNKKQGAVLERVLWSKNFQYELRDDLLDEKYLKYILQKCPQSLVSLRNSESKNKTLSALGANTLWDWPLEWGENSEAPILSLHKPCGGVTETIRSLPETDQLIKLALPVDGFSEVMEGLHWQQESKENRVFLPMSKNGRWSWFRLLAATEMKLNFLRLGTGSAKDQPSLIEVMNYESSWKNFAAILGSPVTQSLTPFFHKNYFDQIKTNILRIDLNEGDIDKGLGFLHNLGLKQAAVTSPLKQKVAEYIGQKETSINTLCWLNDKPMGSNTDGFGFTELFKGLESKKVAVWGGGGTHQAIKALLPDASFYSSRTGEHKGGPHLEKGPDVVVWAVGSQSFDNQGVFPNELWGPQWVVDLNYTLDSPGIQCAYNFGCQYRSGLVMFEAQAKKQQEFWNECRLK